MKNNHIAGTTAQLNGLSLPEGMLAVDLDRKAVRLYDGETLGGYEIVGNPVDIPIPGPQTLIAGDSTAGLYGEVSTDNIMTGDALASHLGLSEGTAYNSTNPWLKVILDNKILFIAKTPYRYSISWQAIYQVGAVYGTGDNGLYPLGTERLQDATVTIAGSTYRIRLLRGADVDPYPTNVYNTTTAPDTTNSEWNRLMITLTDGTLGSYTADNLGIPAGTLNNTVKFGTLCIENHPYNTTFRVNRGYGGSILQFGASDGSQAVAGWRPVLEFVG